MLRPAIELALLFFLCFRNSLEDPLFVRRLRALPLFSELQPGLAPGSLLLLDRQWRLFRTLFLPTLRCCPRTRVDRT